MIVAHKIIDSLQRGNIDHVPPDEKETAERHLWCVSEAIIKAAKFNLGTLVRGDADILRDTGIDQLKEGILALPFPYSYWEYNIDDGGDKISKYCIALPYLDYVARVEHKYLGNEKLFEEHYADRGLADSDKTTIITQMGDYQGGYRPMVKSVLIGVRSDNEVTMAVIKSPLCRSAGAALSPEDDEAIIWAVQASVSLLQAMLGASGVGIVAEPAPERLNKARIKRGRIPLYAHHIIKIGGISSCGNIVGVGMERASPRKHWRRGHVRVYRRGEDNELKTVIPACLINGRGFVSKEYSV